MHRGTIRAHLFAVLTPKMGLQKAGLKMRSAHQRNLGSRFKTRSSETRRIRLKLGTDLAMAPAQAEGPLPRTKGAEYGSKLQQTLLENAVEKHENTFGRPPTFSSEPVS